MSQQADIHHRVARQFTDTANAYGTSAVHANDTFLKAMVEMVAPKSTDRLIDLATGAGNVVLAFAPFVSKAIALDLTETMLNHVSAKAVERGLLNIAAVLAPAESIPLVDASVDIVTVRLAPHHFADVPKFLNEANRVLDMGGTFLLVDTSVPDDPELDLEINRIELLRDPSHVRNYSASQWIHLTTAAGFQVEKTLEGQTAGGVPMDFDDWTTRIRTPETNLPALRQAFVEASPPLRKALWIEQSGTSIRFSLPEVTILATKIR